MRGPIDRDDSPFAETPPGQAASAPQPSIRVPGLDLWRAILMLGGIAYHASILKRDQPLFFVNEVVSGSFRMGAFFLLSGLLSGYALARRPASDWLFQRVRRLGVPTAFGIFILCPLLNLTITTELGHGFPLFNVHHLWFLIALLLYTAMIFCLEDFDRQTEIVSRALRRIDGGAHTQFLAIAGVGLASFLLMLLSAAASHAHASHFTLTPALHIFGDAPMFLLGYLLSRAPRLQAAYIARRTLPAIVIGLTAAGYILWYGALSSRFDGEAATRIEFLVRILGASLCAPAAAALILRSAVAIRHVPKAFARLSEASFTMYIVHYPILALLNLVFKKIHWHPYIEYLIAMLIGGVASYAIHHYVVRRSRLAAFLLNGIPLRRAPQPAPALA